MIHTPRAPVLRSLVLLVALLPALLPQACAPFLAGARVRCTLILPPPPPTRAFLGDLPWLLRWRDAEGRLREEVVRGPAWSVELRSGEAQSILAWPLGPGAAFRPAGLRYPRAVVGPWPEWQPPSGPPTLALTWEGGWLAEVAAILEAQGIPPGAFNLGRLAEEVSARLSTEEGSYDPWSLEPGEVARRLVEGSFRVDLLDRREEAVFHLPGPDPWAPESPFAQAPQAAGSDWSWASAPGCHRLIGRGGSLLVDSRLPGGL